MSLKSILDRADNLNDPALDYMWACNLPNIPNAISPSKLLVEAVDINHPSIQQISRFRNARTEFFPGFLDINGTTIVFYEDNNFNSLRYLVEWQRLVRDPDDNTYGYKSDYAKDITVDLYNNDNIVLNCQYISCWPSAIAAKSLNYNSRQRLVTACFFSIDDQKLKWNSTIA